MAAEVGRAGFDVSHMQHGEAGNSDRRARTLGESMRELGTEESLAYYLKHNPNIVESLTAENLAYVNDGSGGLKRARSTAEVLAYGDARVGNVFRKIAPKSFSTTTFVMQLPKSMCEAVHYTRSDGKFRTRWIAKDRGEMMRYFEAAVDQLGTKVLSGGYDAIHGYDLNLDETTPHIQMMADTFEIDPKHEGKLRVAASKMWGSHPDVRNSGGHQETRFQKMSRYQKEFRERMVSEGFNVELDVDPVRHDRKESKADYVELQEREDDLKVGKRKLGMELADLKYGKAAVLINKAAAHADRDQAAAELEELPELRRKARQEGIAAGQSDLAAREAEVGRRERAIAQESAGMIQQSEAAQRALDSARRFQIVAQEAKNELEAEVLRLKRLPADFERFLDLEMVSGKTRRPIYDRLVAANHAKRGERVQTVIEKHTTVFTTPSPSNGLGPSL